MRQQSRECIVILFICALLALNYPLLELFDHPWTPFGIPLLYLYLYAVWLAIIIVLIVVVEHSEEHEPDSTESPPQTGTTDVENRATYHQPESH